MSNDYLLRILDALTATETHITRAQLVAKQLLATAGELAAMLALLDTVSTDSRLLTSLRQGVNHCAEAAEVIADLAADCAAFALAAKEEERGEKSQTR